MIYARFPAIPSRNESRCSPNTHRIYYHKVSFKIYGVITPKKHLMEKATFAGGCFWCMVKPFDRYDGVQSVVSGYTGGNVPNPSYKEVCGGQTGHVEAVEITFNPEKITYSQLLAIYWRQIDPTDASGQFEDRGPSYQTAIFYHSDHQRRLAEQSRDALQAESRFTRPIVVQILPAGEFYPAEPEHQDFYRTHPEHYEKNQQASGRSKFLDKHWGN